jgi:hypothetical protein
MAARIEGQWLTRAERGAGAWRPCPAGAGDAVVAPCGGDCVALLGPRAHGATR